MSTTKIFLSYLQRDKEIAKKLAVALRDVGIESLNADAVIEPGDRWSTKIDAAIRNSDTVVVLLSSPEAARSSWIGYEVGFAQALGKSPILLRSTDWSVADYPLDLQHLRMVDLDPKSPEKTARALAASLPVAA